MISLSVHHLRLPQLDLSNKFHHSFFCLKDHQKYDMFTPTYTIFSEETTDLYELIESVITWNMVLLRQETVYSMKGNVRIARKKQAYIDNSKR